MSHTNNKYRLNAIIGCDRSFMQYSRLHSCAVIYKVNAFVVVTCRAISRRLITVTINSKFDFCL